MATQTTAYNLLHEDWIPVLWNDGRFTRIGIKDALTEAHQIRQIAATNPMDRVAIIRFLLAVLYWCKGNPPAAQPSLGSFPADFLAKLDKHSHYFNLFGSGKRFYQDSTAQRPRPTTDLLQEIPTGNNFWHFRHSTDGQAALCPACCALGLLRLPLFSVSGLPDLKSGINGAPPIYVVPLGRSLAQTLTANWVAAPHLGVPAWADPAATPAPLEDVPLLAGLTALSRKVWLHRPETHGVCIQCAAKGHVIRTCEFESVGRLENDRWHDPHVVYTDTTPRKRTKASDLTAARKFRMDRPWAALFSRLDGQVTAHCSLFIVGFATDKAKNIDVWERTANIPLAAEGMKDMLDKWQKEGKRMEYRALRSKEQAAAMLAAIRPHVEARVSEKAGALLAGNDSDWQNAAEEYRPMMHTLARSLAPGYTTAAVRQRRQIAAAIPDMRETKKTRAEQ